MAVLLDTDRANLAKKLMEDLSIKHDLVNLLKSQLRSAIDAADVWADSNSSSYNTALPLVARNNLTAKQKALILEYVIARRYEVTP